MVQFDRMDRPTAAACLQHAFLKKTEVVSAHGEKIPEKVTERMKKLAKKDVLHKGVALKLAGNWSADRLSSIKKAFTELDKDGSGTLSIRQVERALRDSGMDAKEAREAARAMDFTCNGKVNWTEFVASCLHLGNGGHDEDFMQLFNAIDEDGDGLIDKQDLVKLLPSEFLKAGGAEEFIDEVLDGREQFDQYSFRQHFISKNVDGMFVGSPRGDDARPDALDSPRPCRRPQTKGPFKYVRETE
jgi:Ca2+-binding EF-hand superfamily protein